MIDLAPVLKIMPIFAIALIVPGPDFMLISTLALSRGRWAGVLGAAGITLGNFLYALICMLGMAVILTKMQWLTTAIRMCGGMYLIYIGVQLWKASMKQRTGDEAKPSAGRGKRNPFVVGLLTNLTNPKAMAFFSSIFALILPLNADLVTQTAIVSVVTCMSLAWFSIVALGLSAPGMRKIYMRWSRWIDRVSGTFLALFGLRLMFSGQK